MCEEIMWMSGLACCAVVFLNEAPDESCVMVQSVAVLYVVGFLGCMEDTHLRCGLAREQHP